MATSQPNQPRRTLLLTGASRGIGHATVKRFSAAGWRVITCSRHPFPENCPWEAGPEDHIQVDLADADDTRRAIEEIKRRVHGELYALVNNAGISPKLNGKRLSAIATTLDVWQHVFQVNFFAPMMLARGLIDELKAAAAALQISDLKLPRITTDLHGQAKARRQASKPLLCPSPSVHLWLNTSSPSIFYFICYLLFAIFHRDSARADGSSL